MTRVGSKTFLAGSQAWDILREQIQRNRTRVELKVWRPKMCQWVVMSSPPIALIGRVTANRCALFL